MEIKNKLNAKDAAGVEVVRAPIGIRGKYTIQHIRDGKVLSEFDVDNGIVNVGKNKLLDVMFGAVAAISPWYLGLVDNASFSAFAAADTMASHAGWIENDDYGEATRPEWTEGAAASQSITNATAVTFTMNATATIKGIFVTSVDTKNGTTGTLWSTAAFNSTVAVQNGDLLKVTYTVSC